MFTNNTSQAKDINMSPLNNSPYFTLKVESFGVSFFTNINGVTIYKELDNNGQISTTIPINNYMSPEKNFLEIEALPPEAGSKFNPNSHILISLQVAPNDNKDKIITLTSIIFSGNATNGKHAEKSSSSGNFRSTDGQPDKDGDIIIGQISYKKINEYEGGVAISRELSAPSTIPKWEFLNSDEIPNLESLSDNEYYSLLDSLLEEYLKIQNAIKNKSTSQVINLFKERNIETDKAFYLTPGTTEAKISKSLSDVENDNDLGLIELKRDSVDFTVEPNNRLISLTRTGLTPAISLDFKNGYGSQRYNLIFRREGNNWILTR